MSSTVPQKIRALFLPNAGAGTGDSGASQGDRASSREPSPDSVFREEANSESGSPQLWLITFADLVGLLLAMFVMLFSMSHVDRSSWQKLVSSLASGLPSTREGEVVPAIEQRDAEALIEIPGEDLDYLSSLLQGHLQAEPALSGSLVQRLEDRVVVSFPADLLFTPGAVELGGDARSALFSLGGLLRNLDNRIEVAGHADPSSPPRGYASNWELSLQRAHAVARLLEAAGYRTGLSLRGYGHSRAAFISQELAQARRLALARRVDIVVHRDRNDSR